MLLGVWVLNHVSVHNHENISIIVQDNDDNPHFQDHTLKENTDVKEYRFVSYKIQKCTFDSWLYIQ